MPRAKKSHVGCSGENCPPGNRLKITETMRLNFLITTYFMAWPRGFGRRDIDAAIRRKEKDDATR